MRLLPGANGDRNWTRLRRRVAWGPKERTVALYARGPADRGRRLLGARGVMKLRQDSLAGTPVADVLRRFAA